MEHKAFPSFTKEIEGRVVTGFSAVFGNIDVQFDIVHRGAFKKTIAEGSDRVRHLWQHDSRLPPVATVKELREVGRDDLPSEVRSKYPDATGGLLTKREYLETDRGGEILAALKAEPPAIREMSFGYDPVKFDFEEVESGELTGSLIRHLREVRLWDTSDVLWGANPATVASKAAVPFRDMGKAPEDESWSEPRLSDFTDGQWADLPDSEKTRIAAHFAWQPPGGAQSFSDLKLAHHEPSETGVGPAIWGGVSESTAAMLKGADIPESDRRGVYNHLVKEYELYDKDPPDFKLIQLAYSVRAAKALVASGRLTEPFDSEALKSRLAEVEQLLTAAEPLSDAEALTASRLYAEYQATQARLRGVHIKQGA